MIEILNDNIGLVKDLFKPAKTWFDGGYLDWDRDFTVGEFKEIDFKETADDDFIDFLTQEIETTGVTSKMLHVPMSKKAWFNQTFCESGMPLSILVSEEFYNELRNRADLLCGHFKSLKDYIEYIFNVEINSRTYLKNNQYAYVGWSLYHKRYK